MKKFEILWELPKCDTETWTEQMLFKKWCRKIGLTQGCNKPSICTKHNLQSAVKQSIIKSGMPVVRFTAIGYSVI